MDDKEVFFVGLRDPSELRRDILGSIKKIIHSLKRYENINELKRSKVEEMLNLKHILREIAFLNSKLRALFPKTKLRALPVKHREQIREKAVERKAVMQKQTDELTKLESELASIEEQLGTRA